MENLKDLTKEEKINMLRQYMKGENLDNDVAFNVFLLICPAKNFKDDFFNHEKVMYSSLVEFVTIVATLKQEMIEFCGNLLGIYEACFRYCVPITINNEEVNVPEHFVKIFALLDFQRIAKLYDTYEVKPDKTKYTNAHAVIYPILRQFSFYMDVINRGDFNNDGSNN